MDIKYTNNFLRAQKEYVCLIIYILSYYIILYNNIKIIFQKK